MHRYSKYRKAPSSSLGKEACSKFFRNRNLQPNWHVFRLHRPKQRRRSSVNFGGLGARHFCRKYMYQKINKVLELRNILPKNARILYDNCRKNIFPDFLGEEGRACPLLLRVSYAYGPKL